MLKKLIGLIIIILLFVIVADAQLQKPTPGAGILGSNKKPQAPENKKHTENDQRGTEKFPLLIKVAPSPNAKEEAAQAKKEKDERTAMERRSEIITRIIAIATAIQAIALIITIIVMIRTTEDNSELMSLLIQSTSEMFLEIRRHLQKDKLLSQQDPGYLDQRWVLVLL